jgi:hypothetical protein
MNDSLHVHLEVAGARDGGTQPVEVEEVGEDAYRVLFSPGFVEGIAAGDTIKITDRQRGTFEVLTRGGNVALKFATPGPIDDVIPALCVELGRLGARLDGAILRAAVWTIPVTAGFPQIESVMAQVVAATPGPGWWYGNVCDDQGNPLNWWK